MATHNEIMEYLVARLISVQSGGKESIDEILSDADKYFKKIDIKQKKEPIPQEQIESIYKLYPPTCPNSHRPTNKGSKNREQIALRIREFGYEELYKRIERYVRESINSGAWLKNFTTILNNVPEFEEEEKKEKKSGIIWQ